MRGYRMKGIARARVMSAVFTNFSVNTRKNIQLGVTARTINNIVGSSMYNTADLTCAKKSFLNSTFEKAGEITCVMLMTVAMMVRIIFEPDHKIRPHLLAGNTIKEKDPSVDLN